MVEVELRRETRRTQRLPGERVGHCFAFSLVRRHLVGPAPSGPDGHASVGGSGSVLGGISSCCRCGFMLCDGILVVLCQFFSCFYRYL